MKYIEKSFGARETEAEDFSKNLLTDKSSGEERAKNNPIRKKTF